MHSPVSFTSLIGLLVVVSTLHSARNGDTQPAECIQKDITIEERAIALSKTLHRLKEDAVENKKFSHINDELIAGVIRDGDDDRSFLDNSWRDKPDRSIWLGYSL